VAAQNRRYERPPGTPSRPRRLVEDLVEQRSVSRRRAREDPRLQIAAEVDDPRFSSSARSRLPDECGRKLVPPRIELPPTAAEHRVQALLVPEHHGAPVGLEIGGCTLADL